MTSHKGAPGSLENLSDDEPGSIHDDEKAKEMGFQGAFVPGTIVASHAFPAIIEHFGSQWMQGGWYQFKFILPVYTNVAVHRVTDCSGEELQLNVETDSGHICSAGRAGLGFTVPWDHEIAGTQRASTVFLSSPLGRDMGQFSFVMDRLRSNGLKRAARDDSNWDVLASGENLAPPELLMNVALDRVRENTIDLAGTKGPGMWTKHELCINSPLYFDREYLMKEWLADKGITGDKLFMDFEFCVYDDDELIVQGRHQSKWFAEA